MILSIASSSPPPQLLILTWTTICHFVVTSVLLLTTPVASCPYTGQVVNTWLSVVNSSKVVHTWQVVKISFKNYRWSNHTCLANSTMFTSRILQSGSMGEGHSCDNKILFTAMLAFTTFLAPHLNIRLFCDNIPRMTWYKITQPPPVRCFNTFYIV